MAKGPTVLQEHLTYKLYTDLQSEFQFPAECHVPRGGSPCLLVGGGYGGERYTVPPAVAGTTVALDDTHLQNL